MSITTSVLNSGITLVTDKIPELKTFAIEVWIKAGSRHEEAHEHGLAHFIEHMAFKRTASYSALEIAQRVESRGGMLAGETTREATCYKADGLIEDINISLDILAEFLCHRQFNQTDIAYEKNVVCQEIAETAQEDQLCDMFYEAAFAAQPIGREIAGSHTSVQNLSPEQLVHFMNRRYRGPNIIIAVSGNIDHQRVMAYLLPRLAELNPEATPTQVKARYTGGESKIKKRIEQAYIAIGFRGPARTVYNYYAQHLFIRGLGYGSASPLVQEIREKRGLAYTIESFEDSFSDCGVVGVQATVNGAHLQDMMQITLDCLAEATVHYSHDDLQRAKAQSKVILLRQYENPHKRSKLLARQVFDHGKPLSLEAQIKAIDRVSLITVQEAGNEILTSPITIAGLGCTNRLLSKEQAEAKFQ